VAIVSGEAAKSTSARSALLTEIEPRLRRALVARYGLDIGCEVAAEAMLWGVENADRLSAMGNPAGYLFRVGQTIARRLFRDRDRLVFPDEPRWADSSDLPGDVFDELKRLKPEQRVAVLLVHGYGFTYREVADLLEVTEAAVTNYVHRGLAKLRSRLEARA
jgi:RNA polymerase sigma factor (sigma-70 family)